MKFNVNNFKDVIKKATLNFSIGSVHLNVSEKTIKSSMITENRNAITDINVSNDVFDMKKNDTFDLYFNEPSKNLMPFINLIDEDEAEMVVKDEKIVVISDNQKSNIHFCSPEIVSEFQSNPKSDLDFFIDLDVDDRFVDAFLKIKKVRALFSSIYFNVIDNTFNIEASDKSNRFSNSLKFDLAEVKFDDLSLKFDFGNFSNLMTVLNGNSEDFKIKFSCIDVDDSQRGMLVAYNTDDSEKYFMTSILMENEI